jgi:HD-GYP domain-containing protein (c-di-GMP phosphodiesterase class II)
MSSGAISIVHTPLLRLNQIYAALNDCNRAVIGSCSEEELFPKICGAAVNAGRLKMAWIGKIDRASGGVVSVAEFGEGSEYVDGLAINTLQGDSLSSGPTGSAIRERRPVWCQDFQNDPTTAPWHERGRRFGWKASASLPLFRNGEAVAALTLYSDVRDAFDEPAQKLLVEMSLLVGHAMDHFVLENEKRSAQAELERYASRFHDISLKTVALVGAISEARDPYTAGHERRVAAVAAAIAEELRLEATRVEGIWVAAMMHDVGKIGVPIEILVTPARLDPVQFALVKTHPSKGFGILRNIEFPWPVAQVSLQHHERFDGSGYPQGLRGNEILEEARIVAVADVVQAMSSHRPYRPSLGVPAALDEIERGSGKLYDPAVADACLSLFRLKHYQIPD